MTSLTHLNPFNKMLKMTIKTVAHSESTLWRVLSASVKNARGHIEGKRCHILKWWTTTLWTYLCAKSLRFLTIIITCSGAPRRFHFSRMQWTSSSCLNSIYKNNNQLSNMHLLLITLSALLHTNLKVNSCTLPSIISTATRKIMGVYLQTNRWIVCLTLSMDKNHPNMEEKITLICKTSLK